MSTDNCNKVDITGLYRSHVPIGELKLGQSLVVILLTILKQTNINFLTNAREMSLAARTTEWRETVNGSQTDSAFTTAD